MIAFVLFGRVEYVEMNTCVNFGAIPICNDWVMAKNVNSDEKFTISQTILEKRLWTLLWLYRQNITPAPPCKVDTSQWIFQLAKKSQLWIRGRGWRATRVKSLCELSNTNCMIQRYLKILTWLETLVTAVFELLFSRIVCGECKIVDIVSVFLP